MKSFPQKILLEDPSPLNNEVRPTACDMPNKESLDDPFISAVGYNNGLLKLFAVNPTLKKLDVIHQSRPHENEIIRLAKELHRMICSNENFNKRKII